MLSARINQLISYLVRQIACSQGNVLLGRAANTPGAAQEITLGDGFSLTNREINFVPTWDSITGKPAAMKTLTAPPTILTEADYIGQIAKVSIASSGRIVFFMATTLSSWVPITAGLIYDATPATGVARWKIFSFTGSGDDRTLELVDL
jgi:hypothetical protein